MSHRPSNSGAKTNTPPPRYTRFAHGERPARTGSPNRTLLHLELMGSARGSTMPHPYARKPKNAPTSAIAIVMSRMPVAFMPFLRQPNMRKTYSSESRDGKIWSR